MLAGYVTAAVASRNPMPAVWALAVLQLVLGLIAEVSRFAMWRRIEQAKRLLLEGTRSVGDIALDLGFSDGSHFGRHFHMWTGAAPGRFRALQRLTVGQ